MEDEASRTLGWGQEVKDQLKASYIHHLVIHTLILTISTYRRFSFVIEVVSKVATNTDLMNTELRENRSLWASDHSTDQCYNCSKCNFLLDVFPFRDTLFNIDCWHINIEFMATSSSNSLLKEVSLTHRLPVLRTDTILNCLALLGGYFKQQNDQQKAQKREKHVALNRPKTLVYGTEAETRRQRVILFNFRWKCGHRMTFFSCSAHVCERPQQHSKYWFWGYK